MASNLVTLHSEPQLVARALHMSNASLARLAAGGLISSDLVPLHSEWRWGSSQGDRSTVHSYAPVASARPEARRRTRRSGSSFCRWPDPLGAPTNGDPLPPLFGPGRTPGGCWRRARIARLGSIPPSTIPRPAASTPRISVVSLNSSKLFFFFSPFSLPSIQFIWI